MLLIILRVLLIFIKKLWDLKEIFHSIHIIKDVLIFKNSLNKFTAIDINSGLEKFSLKSPFTWSTPKTFLLNGKFYIFSSKTVYLLNIDNGKLTESKFPDRLNAKDLTVGFVLDEFQININNIPSSDSGHMIMSDAGVGDAGGGDAGGGGEAGWGKIKIILITGTDGKTSVAFSLYNNLNKSSINTCYIGTFGLYANGKKIQSSLNTTPDLITIMNGIKSSVKNYKCKY